MVAEEWQYRSALLWPSDSFSGRVQLGNQDDGNQVIWQNDTNPDYVKWTWTAPQTELTCQQVQTAYFLFLIMPIPAAVKSKEQDIGIYLNYPFYWTVFAPWCLSVLPNAIPAVPTNVTVDSGALVYAGSSNETVSVYNVYAAEGESEASISISWSSCTGYWLSLASEPSIPRTQVQTANIQAVTSQNFLPILNTSFPVGCTRNATVRYLLNTQFNTANKPPVQSRTIIVNFFSYECHASQLASGLLEASIQTDVVGDATSCPNTPSPPASVPPPPVFQIIPSSNVVSSPAMQPSSIQSYQFVLQEDLASDTVITLTFLLNSSLLLFPSESTVGIEQLGGAQTSDGITLTDSDYPGLVQYTWTSPAGLNCNNAQTSYFLLAVTNYSPNGFSHLEYSYFWTIFIPQCLSSQPSLSTAIPEVPLNVSIGDFGLLYNGSSTSDSINIYNIVADKGISFAAISISWSECAGYWTSLASEPNVAQPQVHVANSQMITFQSWLPQLNASLHACQNMTVTYLLNSQYNASVTPTVQSRTIIVNLFSYECNFTHPSTSSGSFFLSSPSNLTCSENLNLSSISPPSSGLSKGAIAGIILAGIVVVGGIVGFIVWRLCRRAGYDRTDSFLQ